jgi:hypothetical protein
LIISIISFQNNELASLGPLEKGYLIGYFSLYQELVVGEKGRVEK